MKEATGELNVTVIVVIIVALLSFFFFGIIWPAINANYEYNTKCDEAICLCPDRDSNGKCLIPSGGTVECYYKDNNGNRHNITCAWKG